MSYPCSDMWGGGPPNGGAPDAERPLGMVYFAFKPEPLVADRLVEVGNRVSAERGMRGKVSPTVLHATVCPIGYFPELSNERVETACKVAGNLVARSFEIILDRIRTYPNGREKPPLVAFSGKGAPNGDLFRHALVADLRRSGFIFRSKLPDLHTTLFYDRRVVAEEPIDPIRWVVREFVLIHSIYGESRHVLLGKWLLRG